MNLFCRWTRNFKQWCFIMAKLYFIKKYAVALHQFNNSGFCFRNNFYIVEMNVGCFLNVNPCVGMKCHIFEFDISNVHLW